MLDKANDVVHDCGLRTEWFISYPSKWKDVADGISSNNSKFSNAVSTKSAFAIDDRLNLLIRRRSYPIGNWTEII